jgi:hypothetical protein
MNELFTFHLLIVFMPCAACSQGRQTQKPTQVASLKKSLDERTQGLQMRGQAMRANLWQGFSTNIYNWNGQLPVNTCPEENNIRFESNTVSPPIYLSIPQYFSRFGAQRLSWGYDKRRTPFPSSVTERNGVPLSSPPQGNNWIS